MNKALLLSLALLLFPASAAAFDEDEERHYRAAADLLEVLDMEKRSEKSVDAAVANYLELNPGMKDHEEDVREFYGKYLGWKSLENEMLDLFTGEFSEKEIRKMIEFYGTPTGKKAGAMIDVLYKEGVAARLHKADAAAGDLGGKLDLK